MRSIKNQMLELVRKVKIVFDIVALPDFASRSKEVRIESPCQIVNPEYISLGNNVFIGKNSTLIAIKTEQTVLGSPQILIGSNVQATASLQIHAVKRVEIEDDVLIAANVFMVDCTHGYENPKLPFKDQGLINISSVCLKKGSWIGQNVVILQGVTIGEYSIIGANSVVTKSIPARCIAVGSPAKPIKRWNEEKRVWEKYND